ncbi:MAG: hypothetical protein A4E55_01854 [Pelotomaculum sp. PtaU1.Bin035]|nr:MAG: hypothetical protein A4E55_01854 [Pelotomaculum sp. PtaU1.Bin035]
MFLRNTAFGKKWRGKNYDYLRIKKEQYRDERRLNGR